MAGEETTPVPESAPVADIAPVAPETVTSPTVEAAVVSEAPAVAVEAPKESAPSLLEAAPSKPKADEAKAEPPAPEVKADEAKPAEAEGDKKPETKADEAKKAEAEDPEKDATVLPEPPAPVKYEAFKVPDGIKLDDKKLEAFTEVIGASQVKQEDAQKLIDLYVAEKKADYDAMQQEQRKVWNTLNDTWKTDLRKDPVLGGNRLETSLSMAKAVVEEYGGSPEQVRELLAHTSNNGMGNFPGFVRLLHNIGVAMNVFEDGMVSANPSAPKAQKGPGNRGWYDTSMGNGSAT